VTDNRYRVRPPVAAIKSPPAQLRQRRRFGQPMLADGQGLFTVNRNESIDTPYGKANLNPPDVPLPAGLQTPETKTIQNAQGVTAGIASKVNNSPPVMRNLWTQRPKSKI
jgi:hypothetical protein